LQNPADALEDGLNGMGLGSAKLVTLTRFSVPLIPKPNPCRFRAKLLLREGHSPFGHSSLVLNCSK
jgi:hypothetical protein